ncbi:hypothetical protein EJ02DRAFT_343738 [Clathrospora elynae]|uniref:DUF7905 domain-containing protein n=1 Tax=Clathrospora elynae TaxID=706981 RepID=A0A6A5SRG4_9PLEO|nr:hypothetical protein EJ02DRAFT_343738 [Clathrospora elynae]
MDRHNPITAPPGVKLEKLKGKKSRIIPVHPEFRRDMHKSECDRLLEEVQIKTDCIVLAHWEQYNIIKFEVFQATGVEKAVVMLNKWIAKGPMKTKESSAWAKMPAYNAGEWYNGEVEESEDKRKESYKTSTPEGDHKAHIEWPENLRNLQLTPEDAFGRKLQALDPIRARNEVYISLLPYPGGLWRIEIQCDDMNRVQSAEQHVHNMIQKVCTKQLGITQTYNMVLDVTEGMDVELVEAEYWWPNLNNKVVPRLKPSPMMSEPGCFRHEVLHPRQLYPVEKAIEATLNAIRYDRSSYDFVIRLGCLALESKTMPSSEIGKTYSKEVFMNSIQGKVECDVKKWIAEADMGEQILARFMTAKDFLEPLRSAGPRALTLHDIQPMLRVTWAFQDPNILVLRSQTPARHSGRPVPFVQNSRDDTPKAPAGSLIIVQVDWTKDEDGVYEKFETRFYKLAAGHGGAKENMDINLLELGMSRAWHFGLESMITMPKKLVPPILNSFAQGVRLKKKYDMSSREIFAEWDTSPTVMRHLKYSRSDKIYPFLIRNTCYRVELTAMWYPRGKEPFWGVTIRHTQWAYLLAELDKLPAGQRAEWEDTIATFLPDEGCSPCSVVDKDEEFGMQNLNLDKDNEPHARNGIRFLAGQLLRISELVHSATAAQGGVGI